MSLTVGEGSSVENSSACTRSAESCDQSLQKSEPAQSGAFLDLFQTAISTDNPVSPRAMVEDMEASENRHGSPPSGAGLHNGSFSSENGIPPASIGCVSHTVEREENSSRSGDGDSTVSKMYGTFTCSGSKEEEEEPDELFHDEDEPDEPFPGKEAGISGVLYPRDSCARMRRVALSTRARTGRRVCGTSTSSTNQKKGGGAPLGIHHRSRRECGRSKPLESDNSGGADNCLPDDEGSEKVDGKDWSQNLSSDQRRRCKLDDKFNALRSLVPNISKMDKASTVLADAINYMGELERQVHGMQVEVSDLMAMKEAALNARVDPRIAVPQNSPLSRGHAVSQQQQQQHQIIKFDVTPMKGRLYHLWLQCRRSQGIVLQLARVMEALEFQIMTATCSTLDSEVINILVVKVEGLSRAEDVRRRTLAEMMRLGISYTDSETEGRDRSIE